MKVLLRFVLPALSAVVLGGCSKQQEVAAGPPQETPEVKVITAKASAEVMTIEQPGRLEAYRQAEVRARVSGIVMSRPYEEGQEVKAGTPLFLIDPAPLQAALNSTAAALAEAEATHALAVDKQQRYEGLISSNAISIRDLQEAKSEVAQAEARISAAKAAQESAKLQLDYATVVSPIEGRARRANVTEGALVGENDATLLTTVEQIDPIYVNFSQPVTDVMALRKSISAGNVQGLDQAEIKVELVLGDGSTYGTPGKLLFSDLAVDPGTDSVAMRALFPNPERALLPGMYVRVKLDRAIQKDAILVPRVAVVRSPDGAAVMSVNEAGEVTPIQVQAHTMRGDQWMVTSGLKGGEQIIVENAEYMFPGTKVKPVTGG